MTAIMRAQYPTDGSTLGGLDLRDEGGGLTKQHHRYEAFMKEKVGPALDSRLKPSSLRFLSFHYNRNRLGI